MASEVFLQAVDYIVIVIILFISLGIGALFAVKDLRNTNKSEYLLGGRRMSMLPVAISVFATFCSGAAYIGLTADVYTFGAMAVMILFGGSLSYLCAAFTLVPLFYPLRLTSLYEYITMRFHSSVLRALVVTVGMLLTLCYMATTLLAPALALQTGAGLPLWMSIGVVGFIGTVYTAIGGIKSVIWTDALQSVIMLGGALTIILKGNSAVVGEDSTWRIALAGGRASFNQFNLDPRTRNTWWSASIGGCAYWLGVICNQSSLQRISAMKSCQDARNAFLISAVMALFHMCLVLGMGLVMYSYFASIRCDPFQVGHISNINQLAVYFVVGSLRDLPGIGGIFLATLFSGGLSTISSGINALAANTMEDILKKPLRKVTESTAIFITKVLVFFYGILIIGISFAASTLQGSIIQIGVTISSACGGPMLGVFLLGALVPWGNKYGAISGCLFAVVINVWIATGRQLYGRRWKTLPSPPTDMCYLNRSIAEFTNGNLLETYLGNETVFTATVNQSQSSYMKRNDPYSYGFFLYDISYEWYGLIGALVSLVLGIVISYCSRRHCVPVMDGRLLFPFVRKFWLGKSLDGNSKVDTDVDPGELMLQGCESNENNISEIASSNNSREFSNKRIDH